LRRAELTSKVPVPEPPFWGPRTIARVPVKALVPFLNERMLYQFQWGYRKDGRSLPEFKAWAHKELRPILQRMLDVAIQQDILVPQAAYGFWKCAAEGKRRHHLRHRRHDGADTLHLPAPEQGGRALHRRFLPRCRRRRARRHRPAGRHHGPPAPPRWRGEWFAENRYQDYLYLHGLSVEMAASDGGVPSQAHPRRARLRRRGGARSRRHAEPGLSRQPLLLRLSRLPNLGDQKQLLQLLRAEEIGIVLTEERPARPRAVDLGDRRCRIRRRSISRCEMARPVSPTKLMGCLPYGKPLFGAIPYMFAALNLFEMTIHAVGGDPLQRWYAFSGKFGGDGNRLPVMDQLPIVIASAQGGRAMSRSFQRGTLELDRLGVGRRRLPARHLSATSRGSLESDQRCRIRRLESCWIETLCNDASLSFVAVGA